MNSIILNILNTCLELKEYGVDAFFNYSPHVESVEMNIFKDGWVTSKSKSYKEPINLKAYIDRDYVPGGNVTLKEMEEEIVRVLAEVKNDR